jgi:hypothetical protein
MGQFNQFNYLLHVALIFSHEELQKHQEIDQGDFAGY